MKIAFDIDGVLADFTGGFVKVIDSLYPARLGYNHIPQAWDDFHLSQPEMKRAWRKLEETENFWFNLGTLPGHEKLYDFIKKTVPKEHHEIYYVTARVPVCGESVLCQTNAWLDKLGLISEDTSTIVVPDAKYKPFLYNILGVELSIDDKLDTVIACQGLRNHRAYLLERPWNSGKDRLLLRDKDRIVPDIETYLKKRFWKS